MDIPRQPQRKRRTGIVVATTVLLALVLVTFTLSKLRKAAPEVDRATLWIGIAQRGEMIRQVKGPGSLVPEDIRWITAEVAGRVERITVKPGATVTKDTVLLELSNPDVVLAELTSKREAASAELELIQAKSRLETLELTERDLVVNLTSELADVRRRAEVYRAGSGEVYSALDARQFADRETALSSRLELAKRRVLVAGRSKREELAAQKTQAEGRREIADFRKRQIDAMQVRAGSDGIVQDLPLELGQWVAVGAVLARVIQPGRLKAVLRIPELQAKDLQLGQTASVDTRNGVIAGQVARIAPAANQGTVTVEIRLDGELPRGARPDLSIEGTIEIERLPNVLAVERPAGAQPEAVYNLFKIGENGDIASRTRVEFGRSSVGTIEVRAGLREGEKIILSDMTRWDGIDRIKLH